MSVSVDLEGPIASNRCPVAFQILGQVRMWSFRGDLARRWVKPQYVLAALLVDLNRFVSIDQLVDIVWADNPPRTARNSMQWLVSRVRRALVDSGEPPEAARLETGRSGYRLRADERLVDVYRFRALVGVAQTGSDVRTRVESARQALALWRGTPLEGLTGRWAEGIREDLHQEHTSALATFFDLQLRLGHHGDIVEQLRAAVQRRPLAELLAGQLMVALCRSGREAEALACYAGVRRRIVQAVGAEPGHHLRTLHQQILCGDPAPQLEWNRNQSHHGIHRGRMGMIH
jgi:DNA-binding SARP family transcriptional activator